jgi:hypothetical protein
MISRTATKEDLLKFYDKVDRSMKAWVIEDKEPLAIGGFAFQPYGLMFFSVSKKDVPKKTFWKVSKKGLEEGLKYKMPIYAIRDVEIETSDRYLKKLGFKFSHINEINEEIYIWEKDSD